MTPPEVISGSESNSATGTRTRVARVRAEYPSQLDYSGSCKATQVVQITFIDNQMSSVSCVWDDMGKNKFLRMWAWRLPFLLLSWAFHFYFALGACLGNLVGKAPFWLLSGPLGAFRAPQSLGHNRPYHPEATPQRSKRTNH